MGSSEMLRKCKLSLIFTIISFIIIYHLLDSFQYKRQRKVEQRPQKRNLESNQDLDWSRTLKEFSANKLSEVRLRVHIN